MRAVDTNVLIHAFSADSPLHELAHGELAKLAEGADLWAIPWACIHEFFAVMTNPRLFRSTGRAQVARTQIAEWMSSPSLRLISESRNHWRTLDRLVAEANVVGPMVHDARIAAICLDHGVTELLTLDRDFSRFPDLTVRGLAL